MSSTQENETSAREEEKIVLKKDTIECRYPSEEILLYLFKLAISEDKPIMLDYWVDSCEDNCIIGVRDNGEKILLMRTGDEYTSSIENIYNTGTEYIIVTENSIYLVSSEINQYGISD